MHVMKKKSTRKKNQYKHSPPLNRLTGYIKRMSQSLGSLQNTCMVTFVCLVGFLMSLSATWVYRRWVTRLTSDDFTCCHTMTSVSAGHIILTPTQPVGSGRPQRESNQEPPHQESLALQTELQCPPAG